MTLPKINHEIVNVVRKPKMNAEDKSIHKLIPDNSREIKKITELIEQGIKQAHALPVRRDQHAKQHGCVWAKFIVEDGLPERIKVGVFQEPRSFPAWIRFSNSKERDDSKGDPQGMAIKLIGVEGEQALPEENGKTQDFIMVNHPVFLIKDIRDYFERQTQESSQCPMKQASSDLASLLGWLPFFFPSINPRKWRLREASIFAAMAWKKTFQKPASPLEVHYWSMSPYRLGLPINPKAASQAMKFFVKPSPDNALGKPIGQSSNYLREAMAAYLESREASFDFYVQLRSDPEKMPIEDPRIEWKGAPEYKVATIRIPAQMFDSPEQMEFGENLSYTPWHTLAEHEPLGGINRVRKEVYRQVSKLRHHRNGVKNQQEPTVDTYRPHLLEAQLPQNALTVIAPLKPGKVEKLRQILQEAEQQLKANFRHHSPSTHFSRWVIIEDPDDRNGIQPHLVFTSNYDGSFDLYMRELVKVAKANPKIEEIWGMCRDYPPGASHSIEQYQRFLQRYSHGNKKPEVFYAAYRNRTVSIIRNSDETQKKIENLSANGKHGYSTIGAISDQLFFQPSLSKASFWNEIKKNSLKKLLGSMDSLLENIRIVEFLIGIRSQYRELRQAVMMRDKLMFDSKRYKALRHKEDSGCQNELTTLVAIKANCLSKLLLKIVLWYGDIRAQSADGSISNIDTIHFLRWAIFDLDTIAGGKKSYLFFESNYNGSWDSYIDDFIKNSRALMNLVWGNCIGFPKGGCEDMELFKQHIRTHQFPAQIFYSAYPNLTVKNILANLKVSNAVIQLLQRADEAILSHPFLDINNRDYCHQTPNDKAYPTLSLTHEADK